MKFYQKRLCAHLAVYAKDHLGVIEPGTYRGRTYGHILPLALRHFNFLESVREPLQAHLASNPDLKLHKYFHHLNSSQALALNLFYPFLAAGGSSARELGSLLQQAGDVGQWKFEDIPDKIEETNVDVVWTAGGRRVLCEVKLSEAGFGTAVNDARHRLKLKEIYQPRLQRWLAPELLSETTFFANYQILRNLYLLAEHPDNRLVFLGPAENESLRPPLERVLAQVDPKLRDRVAVVHLEEVIGNLAESRKLPGRLRDHARAMTAKYLVPSAGDLP